MGEGFPLFLFSFFTSLLCKYRRTPFFVYHMFVRPLSCTYLYNFIVYALQLTLSYNANQKATFRSYIAKSSRMNIRAHKNITALQKSFIAYWLKIRSGRKRIAGLKSVRVSRKMLKRQKSLLINPIHKKKFIVTLKKRLYLKQVSSWSH